MKGHDFQRRAHQNPGTSGKRPFSDVSKLENLVPVKIQLEARISSGRMKCECTPKLLTWPVALKSQELNTVRPLKIAVPGVQPINTKLTNVRHLSEETKLSTGVVRKKKGVWQVIHVAL